MIFSTYNNIVTFAKRHFWTLMPFLTPKKAMNIARSIMEMKTKQVVCRSKPFVYRIDPCSLCNLRCASCASHTAKTKEKRIMELADYRRIIDKISDYAVRVSLYDMGEPLLNPDIYKMIKYATDKGISTLISTNFNLFKKSDLERLFESGLTVLEPCLDGFTQESYSRYRCGGEVERVKEGIRLVMEEKRRRRVKYPIVDVQVVLFDHIKNELPQIKKFLEKCGVDKITYRQENLGFNSEETTLAGKTLAKPGPCFWPYIGVMIRPDGSLYPCCGRDFDRFSYGNILKMKISEIWNNEYYQNTRRIFIAGPDFEAEVPNIKKYPCWVCPEFKRLRKIKT